jgi:uncharacterized membrane protein
MWFWLGLASSFLSGISVTINKRALRSIDPIVVAWGLFVLPLPIISYLALCNGLPTLNWLLFVGAVGSAVVFSFSKLWSLQVMQQRPLSEVYPLSSLSGLFTYLIGLAVLSEQITLVAVLGLILVIAGAYILNAGEANGNILRPFTLLLRDKTSRLYLVATLLAGVSAVLDKLGINHTNPANPVFVLFVEYVVMAAIFSAYVFRTKVRLIDQLKGRTVKLTGAALVYLIMSLVTFWGFTAGPVALVVGIKKLQVLFVLLFSYIAFKDKPSRYSLVASVIMMIGVVMIKAG